VHVRVPPERAGEFVTRVRELFADFGEADTEGAADYGLVAAIWKRRA
jgi:hypothetical protein